jgi:hypothetical protein
MSLYNIQNPASMVAGQPEDISQVLGNFELIQQVLNGGIDDINVRATASIQPSKLANYPTDPTKFLAGDGTWKHVPTTTAGAIASGPPASPADGDIWIASGIDTNGTLWMFRYNAGSVSPYKWEFLGGAPSVLTYLASTAMAGGWQPYNPQMNPVQRSGVYLIGGGASINNVGGAVGQYSISCAVAGTMGYATMQASYNAVNAGQQIAFSFIPAPFTVAAGQAVTFAAYSGIASNLSLATLSIMPVRVS